MLYPDWQTIIEEDCYPDWALEDVGFGSWAQGEQKGVDSRIEEVLNGIDVVTKEPLFPTSMTFDWPKEMVIVNGVKVIVDFEVKNGRLEWVQVI